MELLDVFTTYKDRRAARERGTVRREATTSRNNTVRKAQNRLTYYSILKLYIQMQLYKFPNYLKLK